MTKSSLFRPMIPSTHKVSIRIYHDFLMIYGKFTFLAITLDLIKIFEFCLNIWGLWDYVFVKDIYTYKKTKENI